MSRVRLHLAVGSAAVVAAALLIWAFSGASTPEEALEPPRFVDESATAGISHTYEGEFTFFVGGGVAAFDCDGDEKSDLFFAGGSNPASLYRNESEVGGSLRFSAADDEATALTEVLGAYPIDIDADGHIDLAVVRLGENVLLRGLGDCRFERANERWQFDGGDDWTAAFSATWEDGNDLPTLAFGNYVVLDDNGQQFGGCADNVLARPAQGAYAFPTALSPGWCTLSILFSDWDRSGSPDLRIANDRHYYRDGEEQLWQIEPGAEPELYDREDGWKSIQIWGMGIASHDMTGDGFPEVVITSQGDNKLQTLTQGPDQPSFGDIAIRRGATAHRPHVGDSTLPSTAWHPEFQDVNNDGFMDLFISKGNVEAMPEYAMEDPNNLLLGQPDGTFLEGSTTAGVASVATSRGAALTDFNLDGLLDLVVVDRRENVQIWRNVGNGSAGSPEQMGNWLAVQLEQPNGNRSAIGSWIELAVGEMVIEREVTIGGGHAGGQLGWIHFGLGPADHARVRVHWPDGEVGPWLDVAGNQFAIIERGAEEARAWLP